MTLAKRREPSRLMTAMASRVEETRSKILTAESLFAHSFELDITLISPHPDQARKVFEADALASLAESFAKQGQLQPILVRHHPETKGHWLIVAGERRWQAARSLGWSAILAIEYSGEHEVAALVENLQRVDLNVLEEAGALRRLIQLNGWSQRAAANAVGRSASDVNGLLKLLELPHEFLDRVLNSEHPLSRNLLIELSRVPPGPLQDSLIAQAEDSTLTIHDVRQAILDQKKTLPGANPAFAQAQRLGKPALGGKRRLDGKAIKRFHDAFKSSSIEAFSAGDREALLDFANTIQKAFEV